MPELKLTRPVLALGEPCEKCAGFGVVLLDWRRTNIVPARSFMVQCTNCAHVRPAQLKLNARAAAAIARALKNLDNFDELGEELRPTAYYHLDAPSCEGHQYAPPFPAWGWVECDPDPW